MSRLEFQGQTKAAYEEAKLKLVKQQLEDLKAKQAESDKKKSKVLDSMS